MNIVAIGSLCVGGIVGALLGKFWSNTANVGLKASVAIFGAVFTGAPVAFLSQLGEERWFYPAGVFIAILWVLVRGDIQRIGRRARRADKAAWWVAIVKVLAVVAGTVLLVGMALLQPASSNRDGYRVQASQKKQAVMPCRVVWIFLGRYGNESQKYITPPAFRYSDLSAMHGPIPSIGDKIVMLEKRNLIVAGYGSAEGDKKCNRMLEPPKDYRPETASEFIAGSVQPDQEFLVNDISFLPTRDAEPTYVWASVRLP